MESSPELYNEAIAFFKEGEFEKAVQNLEALLKENSTFEDAYEALGIIYQRLNRLDEAIEVTKKWVVLNPHALMAHTNLSRFYVAKGMIAEAEHEQGEARRLSWIDELKKKKMAMPKVDPKEKIERFKKVIAFDPKDVLGYYSLGETYLENKMWKEAVEIFTQGLAVDPEHSSSYLGLGSAYQALNEKEEAKEVFEKGVAVADKRGDVMAQKKMQARLTQLSSDKS